MKSKIFGVFGWPIAHSLSPKIQNEFFKQENLDWKYELFPVKPKNLEQAMKDFRAQKISGANITAPHKVNIIKYLDRLTKTAQEINAVNTLYWQNNKLWGDNTDIQGFLDDLESKNIKLENKKILILGAGGSSRAIQYALKLVGVLENNIFVWERKLEQNIKCLDLNINCTPGLEEKYLKNLKFKSNQILYDLVYEPPETDLMKLAQKSGALAYNGLGMLKSQAFLSFQIWKEVFQI